MIVKSGKANVYQRQMPSDIVLAAEPYFEIIELKRCNYGELGNDTDFLAWAARLRKKTM